MRPYKGESREEFTKRADQLLALWDPGQAVDHIEKQWRLGPERDRSLLDAGVEACCAQKSDLPEVNAVMLILRPVIEDIWDGMLDRVSEDVSRASNDDLGPEWVLFLANELWKALAAVPAVQIRPLQDAAARLGAFRRSYTAAQDLLLLLRGKFQVRWQQVIDMLSRVREDSGIIPNRKQAIRNGLETIFGPISSWVTVMAITWSYRWRWIGEALSLPRSGKQRGFRYWNPQDERTSPFCLWVVRSGKILTMEKLLSQVRGIEEAIVQNDVQRESAVWPMLQFTGKETDADFARMFVSNGIGAPPFHWGCRTRLIPL